MNTLTGSASISFDPTGLVDWSSDSYALDRLTAGLDARTPGSFSHSRRVSRLAAATARQLGLSSEQVTKVRQAGALHDVGKVEVPVALVNKRGPLSAEEFELIKRHAGAGAAIVARLRPGEEELAAIVRHHHERWDGSGYPDGLAGELIPIGARVVAVGDSFDALTSSRPYRRAMARHQALTLLDVEAGTHFDPEVVRAFRASFSGLRRCLGLRRVAFGG